MTNSFGNKYAELYDKFYKDKDYDGEVKMLEDIFKRYDCNPGDSILDIGCGTGNHSLRMAKRGYNVTGIDPSGVMLKMAMEKAIDENIKINLKKRGLPHLNLRMKYKGIECMFNVINHILDERDIINSFKNIYEHLDDKGVFVFDFRNAITSLKNYSPKRVLHIKERDADYFRVSNSSINPGTMVFDTQYECFVIKYGQCGRFHEEHKVRAFFKEEINDWLSKSKFKLKEMFPFGEPGKEVDENKDWNIIGVCVK